MLNSPAFKLLSISDMCLLEAQALYNDRFYTGSISRCYHTVFNAIRSLLQAKNIPVRSHNKAYKLFHQHFIKTGVLSQDVKNIPKHLKDVRLQADYTITHQLSEQDARKALLLAKQFYNTVKKYLDANN